MSDITINYKGSAIATMDASGTKTLLTEGKYCEDDIEVVYVKPSGGGSSAVRGTFTPASDTTSVTLSALAGSTLNHFLLKPVGKIANGAVSGKRTWFLAYQDFTEDANWIRMASNASGSASSAYYGWGEPPSARFTFDRTTGSFTLDTTTTNGGGVLAAGITYEFQMW
ncbi:MAG: hypothetical protein IKO83_01645 [Oscillospiraceae bacterium]|nr:hypothetical protein [Oscillospiraceae bacterium]MBR4548606.1 hypothetical protein [Oscillospiraceae bacterium]